MKIIKQNFLNGMNVLRKMVLEKLKIYIKRFMMQLEKIQNLLKSKLKQTQKEIIQNSEQKEL